MYKDSFYMVGNSEHKFASQTLGTRKYPLLIFDAYIQMYLFSIKFYYYFISFFFIYCVHVHIAIQSYCNNSLHMPVQYYG
jgi:hypothetical protein